MYLNNSKLYLIDLEWTVYYKKRFYMELKILFAKQSHSLIVLKRSRIRPQKRHLLAIMEDGDVLGANLHPHS